MHQQPAQAPLAPKSFSNAGHNSGVNSRIRKSPDPDRDPDPERDPDPDPDPERDPDPDRSPFTAPPR
jgi:hypothetical protein